MTPYLQKENGTYQAKTVRQQRTLKSTRNKGNSYTAIGEKAEADTLTKAFSQTTPFFLFLIRASSSSPFLVHSVFSILQSLLVRIFTNYSEWGQGKGERGWWRAEEGGDAEE